MQRSTWARVAAGFTATALLLGFGVSRAANGDMFADPPDALTNHMNSDHLNLSRRYTLHLHHLHTGESLDIVYRVGNTYLPDAITKLNYFLRDHRTNDTSHYDPKEFDVLHDLMAKLGRSGSEIDIVCGFRTPWSNNFLRTRSLTTGVAQHSQHMLAKAIDIRVPGVSTRVLRDVALSLRAGGVGYYPVSQFVHVDVGPVRQWQYNGTGE